MYFNDQIIIKSNKNNMKQQTNIFSRTHELLSFSMPTIDKNQCQTYPNRNKNHTPNPQNIGNLRTFKEYFGKIQPSLYREIKNIFQNSNFKDKDQSPVSIHTPQYQIRGLALTSRFHYPKHKQKHFQDNNNFTIECINSKDIFRKAKLNRLIQYNELLHQKQQCQEESELILKKSNELVKQLKNPTKERRYSQNVTTRAFRVSKLSEKPKSNDNFLNHVNPTNREKFTSFDMHYALSILHQAQIQLSPNICYFNIYIQEGNNSELLKALIRKRNGWRIVEIPVIANFIWTQFYRKGLLKKRLNKREKQEVEEQTEKNQLKNNKYHKTKIISLSKKYDIDRNQLLLNKDTEITYANQLQKLVAPCQAEEIKKMKKTILKQRRQIQITQNVLLHNHFPQNNCISDKKNLLAHLSKYLQKRNKQIFEYIPQSYQLNDMYHPILDKIQGSNDVKDYWIIKPGQNSNRGKGIIITHNKKETIQQLRNRLDGQVNQKEKISQRKNKKCVILQKYIMPLLYNGRKFDIRSYMLVTLINKQLRIYCYEQCYIRTSCKTFDINSSNKLVHLTNDAIQSHSHQYGKYQEGNKLSESTFSKYIDQQYKKLNEDTIWQKLKQQMKQRCIDVIESSYQTITKNLVQKRRNQSDDQSESYYFELFGMDFMIDEAFKLWLIEVNTNPAITHDCSRVLNNLIPKMLDNVLALAVQTIMRPMRYSETPINNRFISVYKRMLI